MWESVHYWEVAAYWPLEGYGGSNRFYSLEEAIVERDKMLGRGYTNVHIREVSIQVIPETMTCHRDRLPSGATQNPNRKRT